MTDSSSGGSAGDRGGGARRRAVALYTARWGEPPELLVRSPGRVNLIGDHTDYNDGFVLPMAIDREVWLALRRTDDRRVEAVSEHESQGAAFSLTSFETRLRGWGAYLQGVAWSLAEAGHEPSGWSGALASDLPVGAGLSSSAALELAAVGAYVRLEGDGPSAVELARAAQRAENEWVGMSCGIMDQLVVAAGRAGHALLIDCRSLACEPTPLPEGVAVLVLDTNTRRELVDTAYNRRRAECEEAARALGVDRLRDVGVERLGAEGTLDEVLLRRARHVVTENARVRAAAAALRAGRPADAGRLMTESHASLRDDFEVSTAELEHLVAATGAAEGCFGARLTGAGFGGCAVALAAAPAAQAVAAATAAGYRTAAGREATVYVCRPVRGVEVIRQRSRPAP